MTYSLFAPLGVAPQEHVRSFGVVGSWFLGAKQGETAFLQDANRGGVVFRDAGVERARLFQAQESGERFRSQARSSTAPFESRPKILPS